MRENRTSGSVRRVPGNRHSYRKRGNNKTMLTFEYEKSDDALCIHADPESLRCLAASLQDLAEKIEKQGSDHVHSMTKAWGGCELSGEAQSETSCLFNHVKVFGWRS